MIIEITIKEKYPDTTELVVSKWTSIDKAIEFLKSINGNK